MMIKNEALKRRLKMTDKIRFGRFESILILGNLITVQIFLGYPRRMTELGATAGWMIPLYTFILAFILFFFISKLYSSFEGKDILEVAQIAGGSFGRILVGLIFFINYIFIIPVVLREFGEDVKVFSLTQSPISFVLIFFIVGIMAGSFFGIEAIVRIANFIVPIVALGFFIVVIGNIRYFNFSRMLPIFGKGPYSIFIQALPQISLYSGLSTIFFITPFIGKNKDFKFVSKWSLFLSAIFLTLGSLTYTLVIPYPTCTENLIPYLHLARYVGYGRFFERVESVFVLIWSLAALSYLSVGTFFLVYIIKRTFGLQYYRPLVLPIAIIIFTLCLIPQSLLAAVDLEMSVFRKYGWIVTFGIPLVVLILAKLVERKKEGGKCDEKN